MKDRLLIGMASQDGRAVVTTTLELMQVGTYLNRAVGFVVGEASNIPKSRNAVLHDLRAKGEEGSPWLLWVDTDILIQPGGYRAIAESLLWAEAENKGVVANYAMTNGEPVLLRSREPKGNAHYTWEDLADLSDYSEVGMAGLGFAYFQQPLGYTFHADMIGEDVHFWLDNPLIRIYLAKSITLLHRKAVWIGQPIDHSVAIADRDIR